MEPSFWHERWQNNQIGFNQPEVNPRLRAFWPTLDAPAKSPVFVPLAGKSCDMCWLREQGHSVIGVELSPIAVRDFFAEQRLVPQQHTRGKFNIWQAEGISLYCGDVFDLTAADLADVGAVYDRASLIALPTELRQRYTEHMMHCLPRQAPMLLITCEYDQTQMSGPPFSVVESEVRHLYSAREIDRLLDEEVLDREPRFRESGLTAFREKVYAITAPSL